MATARVAGAEAGAVLKDAGGVTVEFSTTLQLGVNRTTEEDSDEELGEGQGQGLGGQDEVNEGQDPNNLLIILHSSWG